MQVLRTTRVTANSQTFGWVPPKDCWLGVKDCVVKVTIARGTVNEISTILGPRAKMRVPGNVAVNTEVISIPPFFGVGGPTGFDSDTLGTVTVPNVYNMVIEFLDMDTDYEFDDYALTVFAASGAGALYAAPPFQNAVAEIRVADNNFVLAEVFGYTNSSANINSAAGSGYVKLAVAQGSYLKITRAAAADCQITWRAERDYVDENKKFLSINTTFVLSSTALTKTLATGLPNTIFELTEFKLIYVSGTNPVGFAAYIGRTDFNQADWSADTAETISTYATVLRIESQHTSKASGTSPPIVKSDSSGNISIILGAAASGATLRLNMTIRPLGKINDNVLTLT